MIFDPIYAYWLGGLLLGFLPVELYAAVATPTKEDTFSEFVWWAFGVRPRKSGYVVPLRRSRRATLVAFTYSLATHLSFATTVVPVIVLAPAIAAVLIRAVGWERDR